MARSYSHISEYETEILQLREKGMTVREIGAKLGFTKEQVTNLIARYNRKQRMIKADKTSHPKGRPCKSDNILPPSVQKLDKLAQMRYVLASKERYIKRLEMENELMRDFLSHTERM